MKSELRVRLDENCPCSGLVMHWLYLYQGRRPVNTAGVRVLRAVQAGSAQCGVAKASARKPRPAYCPLLSEEGS